MFPSSFLIYGEKELLQNVSNENYNITNYENFRTNPVDTFVPRAM